MSTSVTRAVSTLLSRQNATPCAITSVRCNHWFASVLSLKSSPPVRAEPKKKKKTDPKREIMAKERLKKKLKKLERVPPEFIPIEDFITPAKCLDEMRVRSEPRLVFDETERRALLLKEWSRYKQAQHQAEMAAISGAMEAQRQALEELSLESEELYQAALAPDMGLLPFTQQGPSYTPPIQNYEAPEGKYNNITKVYTQ
ncbi:39S ribosomal protein L40, mitochondrial [Sardina pilchardus]|uniref:39S ribosomal protein L40, mitochondrial n=1 Tax=Sardina pilchardus TaxID=27697 RepID=UPI002E0DDAAB